MLLIAGAKRRLVLSEHKFSQISRAACDTKKVRKSRGKWRGAPQTFSTYSMFETTVQAIPTKHHPKSHYRSPFLRQSRCSRRNGWSSRRPQGPGWARKTLVINRQPTANLRAQIGFFRPSFADFVTFLAHSKIPSVTRDRFENFRKFWAL